MYNNLQTTKKLKHKGDKNMLKLVKDVENESNDVIMNEELEKGEIMKENLEIVEKNDTDVNMKEDLQKEYENKQKIKRKIKKLIYKRVDELNTKLCEFIFDLSNEIRVNVLEPNGIKLHFCLPDYIGDIIPNINIKKRKMKEITDLI